MNKKDKELLLKDLCARLPYYPKCEIIDRLRVINNEPNPSYIETLFPKHIELFSYHNNFEIKPYLRPMSNMTEEERKEYKSFFYHIERNDLPNYEADMVEIELCYELVDWLNAHHFDYRGLIEKGLAIAVTEDNNLYDQGRMENGIQQSIY